MLTSWVAGYRVALAGAVWDDAVWPAAGVGSYEVENIMSSGQGKFPLEVVTDNNLLRQRYEDAELEGKFPLYVTTTSAQGITKVRAGTGYVPAGARTTPLRYATFGDSTADVGSTSTDVSQVTGVPFPASGNTVTSPIAPRVTAMPMIYPQAYLVANGGISGESTTQMLARDNAAAAATRRAVSDVCDLRPAYVSLRAGSVNDLQGVTAATLDATVAATYANHIEIINRFLSAGIIVIDYGCYGYSSAIATDPASTRAAMLRLNAMYAEYAAVTPNVEFVSPVGLVCDASGNLLPGTSYDGIHLTPKGRMPLDLAEKSLVEAIFGQSVGPRYPGINMAPNPLLTSSGSQAYGTVATAFTLTASNATRQNAKIEAINGKKYQTCEFVPTDASATCSIMLSFNPAPMAFASGDALGFEFDFLILPLAGGALPAPTAILGRLTLAKSGAGSIIIDGPSLFSAIVLPDSGWAGHCQFPQFVTPEAPAAFALSSMVLTLNNSDMVPFKLCFGGHRIVKI